MRTLQLQPDRSGVPDSSLAPGSGETLRDRVSHPSRGLTRSDANDGPLVVIHGSDGPAPSAVAPTMPVVRVRTWTRRPAADGGMLGNAAASPSVELGPGSRLETF
jgi:hypothetical protein